MRSEQIGQNRQDIRKEFRDFLNEELKIVKKNWKLTSKKYNVEINDKVQHSFLERISDRTNLKYNEFGRKIQAGIDYIDTKNITKDIMIGLNYTKSNFIILFLVKPINKYLRVSTVLDSDMILKGSIKWDINEFNSENNTELIWNLNECGPDLDNSVLVESWKDIIEVHFNFSDCELIEE